MFRNPDHGRAIQRRYEMQLSTAIRSGAPDNEIMRLQGKIAKIEQALRDWEEADGWDDQAVHPKVRRSRRKRQKAFR